VRDLLDEIVGDSFVGIDGSRAPFMDHDIMETLDDFMKAASDNNIRVIVKDLPRFEQTPALAVVA
jgi:hypothetical protein